MIPWHASTVLTLCSKVSTLTIFQNLATLAGYDPTRGPGSSCFHPHPSRECVLPWGSGTKSVSSVVLLANGISFAVHRILYVIGSTLTRDHEHSS